jgi:hypothetical protein
MSPYKKSITDLVKLALSLLQMEKLTSGTSEPPEHFNRSGLLCYKYRRLGGSDYFLYTGRRDRHISTDWLCLDTKKRSKFQLNKVSDIQTSKLRLRCFEKYMMAMV